MTTVAALAGLASGTKRTADDLLANMAGISHDQKKARLDSNPPSKVLHLRNVAAEATDAEIIALGIPFGRVTNVLMLKGKNQAFLEMKTKENAIALMNSYSYVPPTIRGRQIYIQYSNHKELTTNESQHSPGTSHILAIAGTPEVMSAAAANSALTGGGLSGSALSGGALSGGALSGGALSGGSLTGLSGGSLTGLSGSQLGAGLGSAFGLKQEAGGSGSILRIVVENMLYPITIEVLNQIFTKFGSVIKIVIFTRNGQFQALVQFAQADGALSAKYTLDGQNIYNGCCTLRIDFSRLTNLNVKYNNDKTRDYTRPELPSGENSQSDFSALGFQGLGGGTSVLGSPAALLGFPLGGLPLANLASLAGAPPQRMQMGSPLVLVSNLNEEMISCDALFTLFGCYGDVQRVKILFNKKDTALVQFTNVQQAQTAIAHLNGARVFGKDMKVTNSKHSSVSLPKEGEDTNLTKDYMNSPLHRFKKPGSKNFQNIFPPNRTLHLSNIPDSVTEEDLTSLFEEAGSITDFRFFPKDRKMAHLSMATTEEAIDALIRMHNYKISETHHLRVSFARSSN